MIRGKIEPTISNAARGTTPLLSAWVPTQLAELSTAVWSASLGHIRIAMNRRRKTRLWVLSRDELFLDETRPGCSCTPPTSADRLFSETEKCIVSREDEENQVWESAIPMSEDWGMRTGVFSPLTSTRSAWSPGQRGPGSFLGVRRAPRQRREKSTTPSPLEKSRL